MKYNHNFSCGSGEIEWKDIGRDVDGLTADAAEEYVRSEICVELEGQYDYSEHYRGIDFELFDTPPRDVIENELKGAKYTAKHWSDRVIELEAMLLETK